MAGFREQQRQCEAVGAVGNVNALLLLNVPPSQLETRGERKGREEGRGRETGEREEGKGVQARRRCAKDVSENSTKRKRQKRWLRQPWQLLQLWP